MSSGEYGERDRPGGQWTPGQGPPPAGYARQQAHYGPPGSQYGAPPPGYGSGYGAGPPRRSLGVVGIVLAVLGTAAAVIAFTATNWFDGGRSRFGDVHDALDQIDRAHAANSVSVAYFGWLAWVLLGVAAAAALLGNVPSAASAPLRVIGALVAVGGIVVTFLAVKLISKDAVARAAGAPDGYWQYLKHAAKAPAGYLAVGGFLLIMIGALVGPRRRA
jgi:hypothetical protein